MPSDTGVAHKISITRSTGRYGLAESGGGNLVSAIVRFFYFFSSIISSIVLRMTISFPGHPIFRSSEKLDLISGSNRDWPSFIFFLLSFFFFLFYPLFLPVNPYCACRKLFRGAVTQSTQTPSGYHRAWGRKLAERQIRHALMNSIVPGIADICKRYTNPTGGYS